MILVVSKGFDRSTSDVIGWLNSFGVDRITRVTEDSNITIKRITIDNRKTVDVSIVLKIDGEEISTDCLLFFWYRNGDIPFKHEKPNQSNVENLDLFLGWEEVACRKFLYHQFQQRPYLGNFFNSSVNKMEMLTIAKDLGFEIPQTIIASSSDSFSRNDNSKRWITKAIREALPISEKDEYIRLHTEDVDCAFINEQKNVFFPSLIQEKIDKWIEIRVFVVFSEVYAMAIFSQNNKETQTDYRNYDFSNMNRMVPYKLPSVIRERVLTFMERCGLNTGSIDLIVTKEKKYVFLEVNPAGNIEMVSDNCNYKIEKKIAAIIVAAIKNGK